MKRCTSLPLLRSCRSESSAKWRSLSRGEVEFKWGLSLMRGFTLTEAALSQLVWVRANKTSLLTSLTTSCPHFKNTKHKKNSKNSKKQKKFNNTSQMKSTCFYMKPRGGFWNYFITNKWSRSKTFSCINFLFNNSYSDNWSYLILWMWVMTA